jgi:hypothetical protein
MQEVAAFVKGMCWRTASRGLSQPGRGSTSALIAARTVLSCDVAIGHGAPSSTSPYTGWQPPHRRTLDPKSSKDSSAPRRQLDGGVVPAVDRGGGDRAVLESLLLRGPGWLVAQTAAARRSVQPAPSGRALSPVHVDHVVSTQRFRRPGPAVQPSSVRPPGVQRVQRPARPVSGRLVSTRPAACCPPRPSGRVHLVPPQAVALGTRSLRRATCTIGTGRVPVGCHVLERLARRPSRPGRGRRCRGRALVSGGRWRPGPGCGRAATAALDRWATRQAGPACGAPSLAAALWTRSGLQREVAAAAAWLPSWAGWATTLGGGRGACRPGGRAWRGQWACRRGWACGPSAAQAGSGRSRLVAGSAVTCGNGWWACQDLNLGPHPYQQSTAERHADRCFPW